MEASAETTDPPPCPSAAPVLAECEEGDHEQNGHRGRKHRKHSDVPAQIVVIDGQDGRPSGSYGAAGGRGGCAGSGSRCGLSCRRCARWRRVRNKLILRCPGLRRHCERTRRRIASTRFGLGRRPTVNLFWQGEILHLGQANRPGRSEACTACLRPRQQYYTCVPGRREVYTSAAIDSRSASLTLTLFTSRTTNTHSFSGSRSWRRFLSSGFGHGEFNGTPVTWTHAWIPYFGT
jgi:hypothetical protein